MTLRECQRRLFTIWMVGATAIFLLVFTRTLGSWQNDAISVWGWFSTTVGPILSFMIAAYIATERDRSVARRQADPALFRSAFAASVLYLMLVMGVLVVANYRSPALTFMHDAAIGLGVAQGIVSALLGYFLLASK